MSVVDKFGARVELPKSPICRVVERLDDWARGRLDREDHLHAWLLKSVLGYSDERIAKAQRTSRRTVRKRLEKVSDVLSDLG